MPTELAQELGRLALLHGLVTEDELEEAYRIQDHEKNQASILTILVRMDRMTSDQARMVLRLFYEEEHVAKDDHRLGGLLLRWGWITIQDVREALKLQTKLQNVLPLRLGELLVLKKVLTVDQVNGLLEYQNKMIQTCSCGTSYNLIKFNPRATLPCYNCHQLLTVPDVALPS